MSKNVKVLVYCAVCIALATVTSMIKVFEFPTGGSITLCSMLFAMLPGFFFGPAIGIAAGEADGILQFIIDPYVLTPVQAILDYVFAFGAFGISGFFASHKNGLRLGYIAACIGRYVFAFLSGWVFFGEYAWEGRSGHHPDHPFDPGDVHCHPAHEAQCTAVTHIPFNTIESVAYRGALFLCSSIQHIDVASAHIWGYHACMIKF